MKKNVKKILGAMIAFAMIISVIPNMAYAAETTSSSAVAENNDVPSSATHLTSSGAVTGVLSSEDDVDYYQYTVDVSGYYNFVFKNTASEEGFWYLTVYDSSVNKLEEGRNEGNTYNSNTYNFKKGTVLYVKVEYSSWGGSEGKVYSLNVNATSDSSWEQEDTDTDATETVINSNSELHGNIYSEDDVDFYKYKVDVSGYLSFKFTNVTAEEGYWYITVYDSSKNKLEEGRNEDNTYTSNTYNFKKGTVLYVKVEYSSWGGSIGKVYSLNVNATADSTWEQENNDTKSAATVINSNSELYGNLYSEDDVDYYKYTVDVSGYYTFNFKNMESEEGNWDLTVYDSSLKELESERNEGYTYNSNTYNFKKGTVLYVKVEYSSWGGSLGKEYSLTVNAKKSTNWEQEKNDSYSKAIALKANKTVYGNLYSTDDVDYYTYTAAKTATLKTTLKFDADDVGSGWEITIYDSSKKVIKTVSEITTDQTFSFKATKGKKYYAVVRADSSYSSPTGITYALKIK